MKNSSSCAWPHIHKTLFVLLGMLILWLGYWFVLEYGFKIKDATDKGAFGDSFGALNTLFSGFAFVALIYTVLLQREELKSQSEELALTRHEIARQGTAQENRNDAFLQQSFENKFFQLLKLLEQALNEAVHNETQGRRAYQGFYSKNIDADLHTVSNRYHNLNGAEKYYNVIEVILLFIQNSMHSKKPFYMNVLASQISRYEYIALFYIGLHDSKKNTLKPLFEETGFLKKFDTRILIHKSHITHYKESAFKQA